MTYVCILMCAKVHDYIFFSFLQCIMLFRRLVVHGFTVDEKGHKMSKSIGNVVDPKMIVEGGKVNIFI